MKLIAISTCVLAVLGIIAAAATVQEDPKEAIRKKLEGEYQLTKPSDDQSDIVSAGSVVVLHKNKVLMLDATSLANPCMNIYRDGEIRTNRACKIGGLGQRLPGPLKSRAHLDSGPKIRNFASGDKFWVTKIEVMDSGKEPGVVFDFFTDAISDVRYKGALLIPFEKSLPAPDDALKLVQEVITVAPAEDSKDSKANDDQSAADSGRQPTQAAPAETPPAPVEPPPPPPAAPLTISVGETIDGVIAVLGQPARIAKAGNKDIYIYKNLRVTFIDGKVTDVQ